MSPSVQQEKQEPAPGAAPVKQGMAIEDAVNVITASIDKKFEIITVAELERSMAAHEPMTVVDCRLPEVYAVSHIDGAINVPFDRFDSEFLKVPKDRPVVAICYVGMFSRVAGQKFAENGYGPVYSVAGGMKAWNAAHGANNEK